MRTKKILMFILLLCNTLFCYGQSGALEFIVPNNMKFVDSSETKGTVIIEYMSDDKIDNLQKTIFSNKSFEINYFKNSSDETYRYGFDSLHRLLFSGYRKGNLLISYHYYENGSLESYGQTIEKGYDGDRWMGYDSNSFFYTYFPNGTIKTKYHLSDSIQPYKEYWPNGKLHVSASFISSELIFCGKYKEYDESGKLLVKGRYCVDERKLSQRKKCGTWKYYENGKRIKKEVYDQNGNLKE